MSAARWAAPRPLLLLLAAAALFPCASGGAGRSAAVETVDVLVYGGTASGLAAGISAANGVGARHSVRVLEPLRMLGGMAVAGGVGLMNNEQGVYGQGLGGRWCALNGAAYGNASRPNCFPEMHVGEASFRAMVDATATLTLSLGCRLVAVRRGGGGGGAAASSAASASGAAASAAAAATACLTQADFLCANDTEPLTVAASAFIDASYDGDVMVAAGGVSYASGREARSDFNESLAGVSSVDEPNESFDGLDISPFWPDGSLLRGISPETLPPAGSADDRLMAFSFFICASPLADGRALPWPRPERYNRSDFELLRRVIAAYDAAGRAFELSDFSEWQAYAAPANVTKILLCCGRAPVNMDEPDLNRGWASAPHAAREAMRQAHKDYLLGSLYFMANDASVNNYTRYAIGRWGSCADEYVGFADNFPPQIYVRVSNRLRGEALLTQNNLASPQARPDGVAVGQWGFDQHTESRRAVADPRNASRVVVANEGYFRIGGAWYDVPFAAMLPRRGEAANLLVPVAISATSVAYASARIEQMFVDLGAAAGVAAALALEAAAAPAGAPAAACPALGLELQDTNVTAVQEALVRLYGQRIHGPPPR